MLALFDKTDGTQVIFLPLSVQYFGDKTCLPIFLKHLISQFPYEADIPLSAFNIIVVQ